MGKVHVHCCESVAENDTSGLAAEGFSGLTELLPSQGSGVGGVCSHAPSLALEHTCTGTRLL